MSKEGREKGIYRKWRHTVMYDRTDATSRQSQGLTQDTLAEIVSCNTSHISNIENNHTKVSLNVLLAIANALNTSIDYLLSDQYTNTSLARQ